MVKKLLNIIKGHFLNTSKQEDKLSIQRMTICSDCSQKESTVIGDICSLCGCPLSAKTKVEDEECDMNKW